MLAATAMWAGALAGVWMPPGTGLIVVAVGLVGAGLSRRREIVLIAVLGVGLYSGAVAADRVEATLQAEVPQGRGVLTGVARTDATPFGDGYRFVVAPSAWGATRWTAPTVAVVDDEGGVVVGDTVRVAGLLRRQSGLIRGDPVAGTLTATEVTVVSQSRSAVMTIGNLVRRRVHSELAALAGTPEAALLSGFLIGDVAALPRADTESLRRAGLTHYVAVSGSNVALVLAAWWLVLGPFGAGNRLRAVTGLAVLVVFVVATRWESSVVRAATMAALVLGGRAAGIPIDAWTALGGAITLLVALSGDLAYDVGFQLSVAATCGVLAGFRIFYDRKPRLVWGALAVTLSAQLAVVPLLLIHFGTIPLLSPVANLVAAPMVTTATALAGIGVVTGWDPLLHLAARFGGMVLQVARVAGEWPQLDLAGFLTVVVAVGSVWRTRLRWVVVVGGALVALATTIPPGPPASPTIVFLDVGQGDAVLLRDPSGSVALVDGGRDPTVLMPGLRRYGVDRIDLVVATHGDADHVGGFQGLFDQVEVGYLWVSDFMKPGDLLSAIVAEASEAGVVVTAVGIGAEAQLGEFDLDVLGPTRRYAEENDGSVVLWITVRDRTVLLPGDAGAIAQRDLPDLRPDLMLVPHHGSATSDLDWLKATVGNAAVISVGVNTYGHPDSDVIATLQSVGVAPLLTRDSGDIEIPFTE